MGKILEMMQDARIILALVGAFAVPAFLSSIFLGYIPEVVMWLLYVSGAFFAYLAIITFFIPIGRWIGQGIKKLKK